MSQQDHEDPSGTQPSDEADTLKPRDTTARSLGTPAFSWNTQGDKLTVAVDVDLPDEPYGNGANDDVLYQVWGTMQDSSTAPNAVAWGTRAHRLADQTTAVSTPFSNARRTGEFSWAKADVKDYFAVQVTVRKSGSTTQDDQTVKVFQTPAAPL